MSAITTVWLKKLENTGSRAAVPSAGQALHPEGLRFPDGGLAARLAGDEHALRLREGLTEEG